MPVVLSLVIAVISILVIHSLVRSRRRALRAEFIRSYRFPTGLYDKLRKKRPELTLKDCQLVGNALRQYFLTHLKSGNQFVSMPSQVVDDLWHELILYTRHYDAFCKKAFGAFMHHTPAVILGREQKSNAGLRRTWWYSCREENINPSTPTRLPLLFAIDKKLGIAGGFVYAANCDALRANGNGDIYCGGDFSSTSFDGSSDGFGDGYAGSDSSSSDGEGGGCGGGCGGGGD